MEFDFTKFSIREVQLSSTIELTDNIIQQIRKLSPIDEDGDSIFYDYYKVEKNTHIGWGLISAPIKNSNNYHITLSYELHRAKKPKKNTPLISEALEILARPKVSTQLSCYLTFGFGKRDKVKSILTLPLSLSESPKLPFDKVVGIHFSKKEGKRSSYQVILDTQPGGNLMEMIIFPYTSIFKTSIVEEVIKYGIEISELFVTKEK